MTPDLSEVNELSRTYFLSDKGWDNVSKSAVRQRCAAKWRLLQNNSCLGDFTAHIHAEAIYKMMVMRQTIHGLQGNNTVAIVM